jgi:DNA-binding MarR family transcriptional regulator
MSDAGITLSQDELDELGEAFVTASRALVGIAIRSIESAPVEVTVPQHRVLVLLAAEGSQGVGSIAQQLGVDPSNATRICDRLQRLHLVERAPSPHDGRAVRVSITKAGRRLVDAVLAHRRREITDVLKRVPPTDAARVVAALTLFNNAAHERADGEWHSTTF